MAQSQRGLAERAGAARTHESRAQGPAEAQSQALAAETETEARRPAAQARRSPASRSDTTEDTPFSCIVTPYSAFDASMVPFLCVTMMNCVEAQ